MPSDFKELEKRLNSDTAERDRFIKSPAAFLRAEGIALTPAQGKEVAAAITKVKVPKEVPGRKPVKIKIIIKIGIKVETG